MHRLLPSVAVSRTEAVPPLIEASSAGVRESAPNLLSGSMPPGSLRAQPGASAIWASAHLLASLARR